MDSIDNLTQTNVTSIFYLADKFSSETMPTTLCKDKILCNAFFEPSTRTSMSFESAMLRLGGSVVNFNKESSSLVKGESFEDTIKTIQEFSDIMVLRHPNKDEIFNATKISSIPIVNGGNGDGEHPTQALIDLYTMKHNIDILTGASYESISRTFLLFQEYSMKVQGIELPIYVFQTE